MTKEENDFEKRSAAAYQAWETRRRSTPADPEAKRAAIINDNAQYDKRSEAAFKAWETRRRIAFEAQLLQHKRSAAAFKAWETRRRMAASSD